MIVTYDPGRGTFILHVQLHEKPLAQQVPGATWREPEPNRVTGQSGAWSVPATWAAYVAVNGIFAHTLDPDPSYRQWGEQFWTERIRPLTELRFAADAYLGDGPTVQRLWPLQRVAVQAMVWAERYLELDEMGGGKTVTALAALKMAAAMYGPENVFPVLVVCPNKVRRGWKKIAHESISDDGLGGIYPDLRLEIMPKGKPAQTKVLEKFAEKKHRPEGEDCAPEECGGTSYDPCGKSWREADVLVTNWESLHLLSRLERFGTIELTEKDKTPGPMNKVPWKTVIADEAHRMKDRKSRQTRALKAITEGTPAVGTLPARFRWALTGTPIANNAAEVWSLLNWLDPVSFPAYTRFIDRYADSQYNGYGGFEIGGLKPQTTEEFHAVFLPLSCRRLRQQFDPFKPRVVKQTLTVPMETRQAKAYNDLNKSMLAELEGGVLAATDAMSKANRLRQLAQAYGSMVDKGRVDPETGETIYDLELNNPSNKVNAMLELVADFGITARQEPGRAIVFGSPSRQLIGLCEAALNKEKIPYTLIAGGMTDAQQDLQERNFELGNTRVALCVISAAKEGLNSLVRADTLVYLQRSDSRVENEQFQGRVDRPGQQAGSVTIIDVVSEGTLEEFDQMNNLAEKYARFQEVVADARVLHAMLQFKGGA